MPASLGKRSRSGEATGPKRGPLCPHGKADRGYYCKECPGKGICEHGRRRNQCKECGGSGICEHGRERTKCKECGGSGICEHGRVRSTCKQCGGSQICVHGRQRSQCKECGGSQICEHGRMRYQCKECGGSGICEHGRVRSQCKECGGGEHLRAREDATAVQGVRGLGHLRAREGAKPVQRVRGGSICEHGRWRTQCMECREARAASARAIRPPPPPRPDAEILPEIKIEPSDTADPGVDPDVEGEPEIASTRPDAFVESVCSISISMRVSPPRSVPSPPFKLVLVSPTCTLSPPPSHRLSSSPHPHLPETDVFIYLALSPLGPARALGQVVVASPAPSPLPPLTRAPPAAPTPSPS